LSLLAMPVIYSFFQIFYILKNQELQTYADILKFLHPTNNVEISIFSELWFAIAIVFGIWLIFFAGVVVSTVIFY